MVHVTRFKCRLDYKNVLMIIKEKKDAFSILFAISAAASLILVMPELQRYIEFYRAIEQFQVKLSNVTMDKSKIYEGEVSIYIEFTVINPTTFAGLEISGITCHLGYLKEGLLQSLAGITQTFSPPVQINPMANTTLHVDFVLKYKGQETQIRDFIAYLQTSPKKVDWIVRSQMIIQAYTTAFPVQIGPFQFSTYLH